MSNECQPSVPVQSARSEGTRFLLTSILFRRALTPVLYTCEYILTRDCAIQPLFLSVNDRYMKLDAAAVRALNLVPSPGAGKAKHTSVVGVLDSCQTPQGKRLLNQVCGTAQCCLSQFLESYLERVRLNECARTNVLCMNSSLTPCSAAFTMTAFSCFCTSFC